MTTPEDNSDPNKRPSNSKLKGRAIFQGTFCAVFVGVATAIMYVWFSGSPQIMVSALLFVIGAALGLAGFFPLHLREGRIKKAKFIAAGGDPTGMSVLMFGAMSGRALPDGTWEWITPKRD